VASLSYPFLQKSYVSTAYTMLDKKDTRVENPRASQCCFEHGSVPRIGELLHENVNKLRVR
jgi:hypothetical protein